MKAIPFKDAFIFHNPNQEEIIIIGGTTEFKEKDLQRVAKRFRIKKFNSVLSEVISAKKDSFGKLKYLHYVLVYGPKSPTWERSLLN